MGDGAKVYDIAAGKRGLSAKGGKFAAAYAEPEYAAGQDTESKQAARLSLENLEAEVFGLVPEGSVSFLEAIVAKTVMPGDNTGEQKPEVCPDEMGALSNAARVAGTQFTGENCIDFLNYNDNRTYEELLMKTMVYHLLFGEHARVRDAVTAIARMFYRKEAGLPALTDYSGQKRIKTELGKRSYLRKENEVKQKVLHLLCEPLNIAKKITQSKDPKNAAITYFSSLTP